MTLCFIVVACLVNPANSEILVFRMQVRAERSGCKAVRLKAEALKTAITAHEFWSTGRIGRIVDIKVAPAKHFYYSTYSNDEDRYMPLIATLLDTQMEIVCKDRSILNLRGTLYRDRLMQFHQEPVRPCLRNQPNATTIDRINDCLKATHRIQQHT